MLDIIVSRDDFEVGSTMGHKIWRKVLKSGAHSLIFEENDIEKSLTLDFNGMIHSLIINIPVFTNSVFPKIIADDADGDRIFDSSSHRVMEVGGTIYKISSLEGSLPLVGKTTFTVILSGAPGGNGGEVKLTFYLV